MNLYVAALCFPVIFIGEIPDKTMFASLVLATRGRPSRVWLGAAAAFAVHVAIAVTIGAVLFALVPHRVLEVIVGVMFALGAAYAWREGSKDESGLVAEEASRHGAIITAFVVVFLAEWGDLTQILTADLAARYHATLAVAVGAVAALWAVAAIAVTGGRVLLRFVPMAVIRKVTAAVLVVLAGVSLWSAIG